MKTIKLFLIFFLVLIFNRNGISQEIHPALTDIRNLSSELKHQGNIVKTFLWNENLTENYILYCETDVYNSGRDIPDGKNKEFYIYHYIVQNGETKLMWKINDFVKDCEFDLETHFINEALTVTDLDANGVNEIWTMYRFGCKSDVSPWPLKLIMYEGNEKYAIRGETRDYSQSYNKEEDSPKKIDKKFKNAGTGILEYAIYLWKINNIPVSD